LLNPSKFKEKIKQAYKESEGKFTGLDELIAKTEKEIAKV